MNQLNGLMSLKDVFQRSNAKPIVTVKSVNQLAGFGGSSSSGLFGNPSCSMDPTMKSLMAAFQSSKGNRRKPKQPRTGAKVETYKKPRKPAVVKPAAGTALKSLARVKKLSNGNHSQYIKRRLVAGPGEGNLLYSGKLKCGGDLYKLHGEGGLLTSSNRFVAQVSIEPSSRLDRATTFEVAKELLLGKLTVVEVLLDKNKLEVEKTRRDCEAHLKMVCANVIGDLQKVEDLFQLDKILSCAKGDCQKVGAEIKKNGYMSNGTKQIISKCIEAESKIVARNRMFNMSAGIGGNLDSQGCVGMFIHCVRAGIRTYWINLLGKCPSFMQSHLKELAISKVLLVKLQDLKLFADLNCILNGTSIMNLMTLRYINMLENLKIDNFFAGLPTTNPILVYLCKSFSEVVEEVKALTSCTDIAQYTVIGWIETNVIPWRITPSMLERSLEHQIKLLLKLMNNFDVGSSSSCSPFPYAFKVFGDIEANAELKHIIEHVNRVCERCSDGKLPDNLRVWIYILDDTIAQLFVDNQPIRKLCSALLNLHLLEQLTVRTVAELTESFRVITHHTIRFVALAESFVNSQNDRDSVILKKLGHFMNRASVDGRMTYMDVGDLIEVFGNYWNKHCTTIDSLQAKLPGDHFKTDIEDIRKLLLQCMAAALDKNVQLVELKNFYRAFENLLLILQNLTLDWFIRIPPTRYTRIFIERGMVEKSGNNPPSFQVKNVEKFVKLYTALFENAQLPRHYAIDAVKSQLTYINAMVVKSRWGSSGPSLTESDQLDATKRLIDLVRFSVSRFKKQPDCSTYERFLEKCSEPFANISMSTCWVDFEKGLEPNF